MGNETNDIIKEFFKYFLDNYQKEVHITRGGSNFFFESVNLLYYSLHKTRLKRDKSYINSSKWLEIKRATINPQNNDDKCRQYTTTVALNHQNIENNPARISNIEPFINQYNWNDIDIKAHQKGQEDYEKSKKKKNHNKTIDWKKI